MQSDLMWLWSPLTGADHRELAALLYRLSSHACTHLHRNTRPKKTSLQKHKRQSQVRTILFVCMPWCLWTSTGSFRADSHWTRYGLVMNPVARLARLRFLLHIPGRCQGPHRRQRSLPKSHPCYTDKCVLVYDLGYFPLFVCALLVCSSAFVLRV